MATVVVAALVPSSSTLSQQPCSSSWTRGTIPIPNLKARRTSLTTWLNQQPRAALFEATPPPSSAASPSPEPTRDGSHIEILALPGDRADDIQAEARALTRATNASVYSPQLVASRYGSKPFKVPLLKILP